MTTQPELIFFHSPQTRSTGALILLEELQAPHRLHLVNMKAGEQRSPAFLAVNPMGKVPAIRHGEAVITEQVAVYLYLADLFPQARLAPPIGDPRRGPYLRWLAYYGSCFEPAVVDRAMKREAPPPRMSPYGDYDTVINTLSAQLARGPYMLGTEFSAADVLWGTALGWTTTFKLVPERPEIMAYIERIASRPAAMKITAQDKVLAAEHEAAAGALTG
jgi:glutathione S-transferase